MAGVIIDLLTDDQMVFPVSPPEFQAIAADVLGVAATDQDGFDAALEPAMSFATSGPAQIATIDAGLTDAVAAAVPVGQDDGEESRMAVASSAAAIDASESAVDGLLSGAPAQPTAAPAAPAAAPIKPPVVPKPVPAVDDSIFDGSFGKEPPLPKPIIPLAR